MKSSSFTSARRTLAAAFAGLAAASTVQATVYYWDADGATAGFTTSATGTWGTSAFWSTDSTGSTTGAATTITNADDVNFGTAASGFTAASTVTISGAQSVNSITFGAGNTSTLLFTGGTSLTLGSSSIITNNSTSNLQFNTSLAGTNGFTKAGTGTVVLAGSGTSLTGGITISDGVLQANTAASLSGVGTITIGTTAGKNARLTLFATNPTITNAISIGSGAGVSGSAALLGGGTSSNSVVSGDITITSATQAGGHFGANVGNTLTLAGKVNYASGTVVQRIGTVIYSGTGSSYGTLEISNAGGTVSLAKLGVDNGLATNAAIKVGNATGTGSGTQSATFDLAGFNQSATSILGSADSFNLSYITNSGGNDSTLTLTSGTNSYDGVIQDGTKKVSLTLTGANQTLTGVNTYTGGTTISSGTLNLGNATNTLADTGAVTVSGGTLALGTNSDTVGAVTVSGGSITGTTGVLTGSSYALQSGTVSAILGGTGVVATKTTSGTVTISGVNTYTGGTNINAGTLTISNAAALGSSGTISFGGGTLRYSGINTDLSSRFSTAAGQAYNIDTNGQNVILATALSSSGSSLTKSGTGNLTLSVASTGGTATTLTGAINVNAGRLSITDGYSHKNSTGTITVASGATFNFGQNFISGNNLTNNLTLNGSGDSTTSFGAFNLGGNATASGTITLASASTITHDFNNGSISGSILTAGNALTLKTTTASQPGLVVSGAITGGGGVTVTGVANSGTYSVRFDSNSNTYSGGTTVTAGTLATSTTGNFGTGDVTVASGAFLTLGNAVSIADTARLTFASTSTAGSISLGFAETVGSVYDSVTMSFLTAGTYNSSALNTYFSSSVFTGAGSLTVSAIPEPSTAAAIAGFGALLGAFWRRRRFNPKTLIDRRDLS